MATRLGGKIRTLILIGSVLVVSACATSKTNEANTSKTDETSSITIEKGKFEAPPEIKGAPQPATSAVAVDPAKNASATAPDAGQAAKANITRVNTKEKLVNVRTAPSTKSRTLAVLKGGQTIEILETKQSWLKIKWQAGDVAKQGWMNRRFVEGYEQ
jgi:uncharacterized protein YgiM (DUF1202 family)